MCVLEIGTTGGGRQAHDILKLSVLLQPAKYGQF